MDDKNPRSFNISIVLASIAASFGGIVIFGNHIGEPPIIYLGGIGASIFTGASVIALIVNIALTIKDDKKWWIKTLLDSAALWTGLIIATISLSFPRPVIFEKLSSMTGVVLVGCSVLFIVIGSVVLRMSKGSSFSVISAALIIATGAFMLSLGYKITKICAILGMC